MDSAETMRPLSPSIVSPAFDFGWFVLPGIVAAVWALALGWSGNARPTGIGLWIAGVLLVDVAHVYASLFRTYFDPQAWRHHRARLVWTPIACCCIGTLLHASSPAAFWTVLAYVAIFHFIKQHVGFALLYVRKNREPLVDRRLTALAIWAGTAAPVVYWHAHLPTQFVWFVDGDLVAGLPAWVGTVALAAEIPIWVAFVARRILARPRGRRNPMVLLLALVPAVNWHLGIVVFDDDRIFTITNVFLHGIPYLALVWIAGGRDRVARWFPRAGKAATLGTFYAAVVALAVFEEAWWDRLVWHDHPQLFGASELQLDPSSSAMAVVVAVLAVPQATHYLLDRWIWRVGPRNPRLAEQLGLDDP